MPIPLVVSIVTALIGAAIVGATFAHFQRSIPVGAALGALAGVLGPQIFMVPLQYCTFDPKLNQTDFLVGLGLIGVGTAITVLGTRWIVQRRFQGTEVLPGVLTASGYFRGWLTPFFLLLPTLIILLLFLYYPFLDTFRVSTQLRFVGIERTRFVCVTNFITIFTNPDFLYSVFITFVIAGFIVVISLVLSLLIATVAQQQIRGASVYRTLLVWPYAVSPAVAGVLFSLLFDPVNGGINHVWQLLFNTKLPWLLNGPLTVAAVILTSVWKTLGFGVLFYIAGLQNVPNDLREAASIDGANVVQRFLYIVVPMLSPITFFLIITTLTYSFFDIFGTIDILTTGGPVGATTVLMYQIYKTSTSDLGLASAQSVVLFILVLGVTAFQFMTTARRVNYNA